MKKGIAVIDEKSHSTPLLAKSYCRTNRSFAFQFSARKTVLFALRMALLIVLLVVVV